MLPAFEKTWWGKGTWKVNNSHLSVTIFKERIQNAILVHRDERKYYNGDDHQWWEDLKSRLQKVAKLQSNNIVRVNKQHLKELEINLADHIARQEKATDPDLKQRLHDEATLIKEQISDLEFNKSEGARIRAKILKIEDDERSTKYFFQKEKGRAMRKTISTLLDNNGVERSGREEIIEQVRDFYETLYTSQSVDNTQIEENINQKEESLCVQESESLNGIITKKEIMSAIKSLIRAKAQGTMV
jgi:hypothetical protein